MPEDSPGNNLKRLMMKKSNSRNHKLKKVHKLFIVQKLAEMEGPTEIAVAVKREFNISITPQAVFGYSRRRTWKNLINETREKFKQDLSATPISDKAYRMKQLQLLYNKIKTGYTQQAVTKDGDVIAFDEFDPHAVVRVLAQAQKEMEPVEKNWKAIGETNIANTGTGNVTINQYPNLESKSDDELADRKNDLTTRLAENFGLVQRNRIKEIRSDS